jgi:hypothetical protein
MSNFERHGFLSEDDLGVIATIEKLYPNHIRLCKDLNQELQTLQYDLKINNANHVELLSGSLYAHFLSTSQASLITLLRGMKVQTRMLIRCMLEPLFPLAAVSENRDIAKKFIQSSAFLERRKKVNAHIAYQQKIDADPSKLEDIHELKKELNNYIEEENVKPFSIYDCAEAAGLLSWYETLYRYTSDDTHSSVMSLQELLISDDDGVVKQLKNEPEVEGIDELLITISLCQAKALESISSIFSLDNKNALEEASERINNLV